ncbi:hypothetical protein [Culicoidibacter larvae]|uniref:DUF3592 domain-containing protein n=1 Tax=Culicoidibacter larvae TaxID=2579976 RepID=A0A5R8QI57_9FIRM|nr:hypothetical protein [Culicoidibacter larvae]TLG77484.1 hypothetical protein FEZ08_02355 [Culicoidibacter larvae]
MSIVITVLLVILLGIAVYNMMIGNEMILFSLPSIFLITLALSANIGFNFGPMIRERQKVDLSVTGVRAVAYVQGYKVERLWANKTVNVRVTVEVELPLGGKATTKVVMQVHVHDLAKFEPGAPLHIIYDPETLKAVADDITF